MKDTKDVFEKHPTSYACVGACLQMYKMKTKTLLTLQRAHHKEIKSMSGKRLWKAPYLVRGGAPANVQKLRQKHHSYYIELTTKKSNQWAATFVKSTLPRGGAPANVQNENKRIINTNTTTSSPQRKQINERRIQMKATQRNLPCQLALIMSLSDQESQTYLAPVLVEG